MSKYISLEAKIAKNKDLYYDALGQHKLDGTREQKMQFHLLNICWALFFLHTKILKNVLSLWKQNFQHLKQFEEQP